MSEEEREGGVREVINYRKEGKREKLRCVNKKKGKMRGKTPDATSWERKDTGLRGVK